MTVAKRVHFVHLLRHGHYAPAAGTSDGPLTALGKRQAQTVGKYLRRWPIQQIWASDARRATETALIVSGVLDVDSLTQTALLREIVPTRVNGQRVPLRVRSHARDAVERVASAFMKPVRATRHDLIVCHGNLIRALVCHILQTPKTVWVQLATYHCALTTIAIMPGGRRTLVRYGESGYLKDSLLTAH